VPSQPQKSPAGKVSVACPHCRASQLESVFAKTTICRSCGRGFEIGKTRSGQAQGVTDEPADEHSGNAFLKRLQGFFHKESIRRIVCSACGAQQQVSNLAKSSLCPHCGGYIDLRDFKITTSFSRSIQTQGTVHVTSKGDLTSSKVSCADALICGNVHGSLQCTGTARFKMRGRLVGQIDCQEIVIEKRSEIEFVRPIKAHVLRIAGKISASVNVDSVIIENKGCLEGTVYAKSITVDKGGIFHGELFIGKQEMVQAELLDDGQAEMFAAMKRSPLRRAG
jgi:cytoskeletal protein CcmA (bactofilin family)